MFEKFSEHVETTGYAANYMLYYILDSMLYRTDKRIIDHPLITKILKDALNKAIFNLDFMIPMKTKTKDKYRLPKLTIGEIVSKIYPILCERLENLNEKIENNRAVSLIPRVVIPLILKTFSTTRGFNTPG